MKTLGFILYEGPSIIDGKPIVVIVNKLNGSDNAKTGAIVQSFILRSDVAPTDALKSGADASVCGQCEHRPILAKHSGAAPCYVNVGRSVRSVYDAYRRGRYTRASVETIALALAGKSLRIGTYGDPAAAPVMVWQRVTRYVFARAGYSHQWDTPGFDHAAWAPLVMASADTVDQAAKANLFGMRVFRVSIGADIYAGETTCPASAEGGRRATCATCMLCGGTSKAAKDIVIADHAVGHNRRRVIMMASA
jgi:hypothetical protein